MAGLVTQFRSSLIPTGGVECRTPTIHARGGCINNNKDRRHEVIIGKVDKI